MKKTFAFSAETAPACARDLFFRCMVAFVTAAVPVIAHALPSGWTVDTLVFARDTSGSDLADYQVRMVVDTAAMVAAGNLRADAGDLRFAGDSAGTQSLAYWIESGPNTSSTVIWVRVPAIPANWATGFHMFSGNPAATSESTLDTFDFTDDAANSSTNQVWGGAAGGVGDSQRGFRFYPNEDVLMTHLGKNEPTGTDRYITLFDNDSHAVIVQGLVAGPAAQYSYQPLDQPVWLLHGKQYLLEMYQNSTDGYYYGGSTQINPRLTYLDMRYCNSCTKDTFPANYLTSIHYGYPDFLFRSRKQAPSEPAVTIGGLGPTRTTLTASASEATIGTAATFTATLQALLPHASASTFSFTANGSPIPGCTGLAASGDPLTAACTIDALPLGENDIEASWSGDGENLDSASDLFAYTVVLNPSQTSLAASLPASQFGTPITFTASTDAGSVLGQPAAGTFTFRVDGVPQAGCTNLPPAATTSSTAACTLNALWIGIHGIQVEWSGDANHEGSTSLILSHEIQRLATQTQLATGCESVFADNQPLTLYASATGTFEPIGAVDFSQNGTLLCEGVPLISGVATCTTGNLVAGSDAAANYLFTASYAGDDLNAPSMSPILGVTVLSAAEAIMHDGFEARPDGCPTP